MDRELEIAAAVPDIGASATAGAGHMRAPGSPCANCGVILAGPYCHACGQLAEDFEDRSIGSLLSEAFEGLLHIDGRLFRTLPRLVFRPASLTRDYLAGKRASQLPPLRLFLVVVLLYFLAGGLAGAVHTRPFEVAPHPNAPRNAVTQLGGTRFKLIEPWLQPRVNYALAHPREFGLRFESGLHNLAILFLPISTALLCLLFPFSRRFRIYDHAIFSMHSLSFVGLLFTAVTLVNLAPGAAGGLLALGAPVHLFVHMRGVYGTSVVGTLARMALLFVFSVIAFTLAILALVLLGLNALGAG